MAAVKTEISKPTRREQAARTRRRMLDAAYELFCEFGFRATKMEAIAERAGVAVQTLYFTFHTKDELIQAVHERTVLGDDPTPPPMQPWYHQTMAEPDIVRAVHTLVTGIATILARVAPMVPAFLAVAGDPAGDVWRHGEALRLQGMGEIVEGLARKAKLRRGLSRDRAADVLYVLIGPDLYRTLILERGWTKKEWAAWIERSILAELFNLAA
jgi:AcrR family transcriptional regulator